MNSLLRSKGFALPAVLISSVVMMSVLLVSLTSISSTSKSIELQYEGNLLEDAVEAGLAYANACIKKDGGNANWTYLYPGSSCSNEYQCIVDSSATCWLYDEGGLRTTFEVSAANFNANDIPTIYVTAKSVKVRASTGEVAVTQSSVAKARLQPDGATLRMSAGSGHVCAVAPNSGDAYCWGGGCTQELDWDYYYATYQIRYITVCHPTLGDGTNGTSSDPLKVTNTGVLAGKTIMSLSSQGRQTCALASDYKAYCWGQTSMSSEASYSSTPVAVAQTGLLQNMTLRYVGAGVSHACAIASDNNAYCWGDNTGGNYSGTWGKLGDNTGSASKWTATPVAVYRSGALSGLTVRQMSVGTHHACVIASDNNAYCWGDGGYNALGNNNIPSSGSQGVPVAVYRSGALSGLTIRQISAGWHNTCVIASNNKAYCWGVNTDGQLGNGNTTSSNAPVAVAGGYDFTSISVGTSIVCGIATNNNAYCWGNGAGGRLGNGSTGNSSVPVQVTGLPSGVTLASIQLTDSSTCGAGSDGKIYCWGGNSYGQLGNGNTTSSLTPVVVASPFNTPPLPKFNIY